MFSLICTFYYLKFYSVYTITKASHQAKGSPEQKLRWQFRLYDKDGSGTVALWEMVDILVMIFQNHYNREESVAKAEQMFAHLDEDGNGDLTEVGAMYYIGRSVRPPVTMLGIG